MIGPFTFTDPYADPTPHLLAALVVDDPEVRLLAAQTIRKLPSSQAIPVLIERLRVETEDAVLAEVVETLGLLRARDAVGPLILLASHPDELVRANVAEALGWIGIREREVTGALLRLLDDSDEVVRCYAAEALGDVGQGREAVLRLRERQEMDDSMMVRVWCVYGRCGIGDELDWDTLGEAFGDDEAIVRRQAFLALRMLVTDETIEPTMELLRAALLNETDNELRADCVSFLATLEKGERYP